MKDERARHDYLWDGSGEPDLDVERLEALLAPYRHRGALAPLPLREPAPGRSAATVMLQLSTAAASVALVAAAAWSGAALRPAGWDVQSLAGAPSIAGVHTDLPSTLPIGATMTTDAASRARLDIASVGSVDVEPNSRVRLIASRPGERRLALDRGGIRARIWAPPGRFFVNTPSSTAVDLGCAYSLDVDESGAGIVRVESGWVAFEYNGRESFIPTGAMCATRPRFGPGTPYYEDAPDALAQALTILDFSTTDDVRRPVALEAVLSAARPRDAVTLWHMLSRGTPAERARVFDRMAVLVPPPEGVTRQAVIDGDRAARDAWWNTLGLDSASWWRIWKTPWK